MNASTVEVHGDKFVNGLTYLDLSTNEKKKLDVQGIFVEIGQVPNSQIVENLVELNDFINTHLDLSKVSVPETAEETSEATTQ